MSKRKYTIEEVKSKLKEKGYELLDDVYNGVDSSMTVIDEHGYLYYSTLYRILRYEPHFVHKSNIYSVYNIKKWLICNKNQYELLSEEYIGNNKSKLKWKCLKKNCEKTFEMPWVDLSGNKACPHCNRKVANEFNNLEYLYPELAKEWHPTKNGDLKPNQVTSKSDGVDVWWQCLKNTKHEWKSSVWNRHKNGCPYCSGRKPDDDRNLFICFPEIMNEWDYDKNKRHPSKYTPHSSQKVWWNCLVCNHEWKTAISHRTNRNTGCPACSGQVANEQNCFATKNPSLISEWDAYKNGDLTPYNLTYGSNKRVWWKCTDCKNEWFTSLKYRSKGIGCPVCSSSTGERCVTDILKKFNLNFESEYSFDDLYGLGGGFLRFDFCIFDDKKLEIKALLEYDGIFHFEKQYEGDGSERIKIHDELKNKYCEINNLKLIRIPYWDFDNIEEIIIKELDLNIHSK